MSTTEASEVVAEAALQFVNDRFSLVGSRQVIEPLTATQMRGLYDRPLRLLRTLAGMSETQAAALLDWDVMQVRTAEALLPSTSMGVSLVDYMLGLGKLAVALSAHATDRYQRIVWGDDGIDSRPDAAEWFAHAWGNAGLMQRRGLDVQHLD